MNSSTLDSPFPPNTGYQMAAEPTALEQSQLHSPASLKTDPEGDCRHDHVVSLQGSELHQSPRPGLATSPTRQKSGSKRNLYPLPRFIARDERKKVSRACDLYKMRKVRCSGLQPCQRCLSQSVDCEYNAEHRRGRPASPLPSILVDVPAPLKSDGQGPSAEGPPLEFQPTSNPGHWAHLEEPIGAYEQQQKSSRTSHEPEETLYEGHYTGPTSGIAFMHRVQRRFKQDLVAKITSKLNGKSSVPSSVFTFGDGHIPEYSSPELVFPSREKAEQLVTRYFDFAMPTYRFLDRPLVEKWLEVMCEESGKLSHDWHQLSNAKTAIVLLILATSTLYGEDGVSPFRGREGAEYEQSGMFYATAESKLSVEIGPVRLESVQARLAQCIYLLGSSRINQAWYIFGTATQMILAPGPHRNRYSQSHGALTEAAAVEIECRRRVFWSAYTLDRYLSVILGRPRIIRDEDIDQTLPCSLNDIDLPKTSASAKSGQNQRVADGPIFHAKLAKIIGGISTDLYPTSGIAEGTWMDSAERWTSEVKSTVLKLAYAHALIFANRQSLPSNFAELSRRQNLPSRNIRVSLKECIDAAVLVVDTVNSFIEERRMSKAFWFTHYISFCAIATLYVYTIQKSLSREPANSQSGSETTDEMNLRLFQSAEKCQRGIVETTAENSPFRRYNIILGELHREVLIHISKTQLVSTAETGPANGGHIVTTGSHTVPSGYSLQRATKEVPNVSGISSGDLRDCNMSLHAGVSDVTQGHSQEYLFPPQDAISSIALLEDLEANPLDVGLFGSQGQLVGWSEFDAYAINWPDSIGWIV